jgi:hypothetical protein
VRLLYQLKENVGTFRRQSEQPVIRYGHANLVHGAPWRMVENEKVSTEFTVIFTLPADSS